MLKKAERFHVQAKEYGFYWENLEQILDQIRSECQEVAEAYTQNPLGDHLQEELGDMLFAAAEAALYCGFDPQDCLESALRKYEGRFERLVAYAQADGLASLKGVPMSRMLEYWKRAKES